MTSIDVRAAIESDLLAIMPPPIRADLRRSINESFDAADRCTEYDREQAMARVQAKSAHAAAHRPPKWFPWAVGIVGVGAPLALNWFVVNPWVASVTVGQWPYVVLSTILGLNLGLVAGALILVALRVARGICSARAHGVTYRAYRQAWKDNRRKTK